jgi:RimJ/RimL family protein N-acetyltransferase
VSKSATSLELRGEHIRIRWWNHKDDVTQRSWPRYSDPFYTLWNIPRSQSLYGSLRSFSSYGSNMRRVWAIDNLQNTLIGRISLRDVDEDSRRARLGISLGAPYVGQGLGTEAMLVFLDYFFDSLGFETMVLDVAAFNRRAVCCYEHLGFQHISEEWRKSSSESSFMRQLDDPKHRHLLPYFRRERFGVWVLFLEMELHRHQWYQHRPTRQQLSSTGS